MREAGAPALPAVRHGTEQLLYPADPRAPAVPGADVRAGAAQAVDTYKAIKDDQTLKGLLVLFGSLEKLLGSFKVDTNHAYGYDEKGNEAVKVPLRNPCTSGRITTKNQGVPAQYTVTGERGFYERKDAVILFGIALVAAPVSAGEKNSLNSVPCAGTSM